MVGEGVIAFSTLFLWFAKGIEPVELMVAAPATRVELFLDGSQVAELTNPPWRATIDLGEELTPHRLVAIAYNDKGRKLARVEQTINLPRPEAELEILLENDASGALRSARLGWTAAHLQAPSSVSLALDGKSLKLDKNQRATLPKLDLKHTHVLRGEVAFGSRPSAIRELAFGGEYVDRSQSELTAVAVTVADKKTRLERDVAERELRGTGKPVQVVAIDETAFTFAFVFGNDGWAEWGVLTHGRLAAQSGSLFRWGGKDTIMVVDPRPDIIYSASGDTARLYPVVTARNSSYKAILQIIKNLRPRLVDRPDQDIDAAVAGAGMASYAQRQRRAVILVGTEDEIRGSEEGAPTARRYLWALGVPLHVWILGTPPAKAEPCLWGEVAWFDSSAKLIAALGAVAEQLERQRIIWIDGTYLPQEITLAGPPSTFDLAR